MALDVDDGRTVWRTSVDGPLQGGPLIVRGGFVVGVGLSFSPMEPGAVVRLSDDGRLVWWTELARASRRRRRGAGQVCSSTR